MPMNVASATQGDNTNCAKAIEDIRRDCLEKKQNISTNNSNGASGPLECFGDVRVPEHV